MDMTKVFKADERAKVNLGLMDFYAQKDIFALLCDE